MKIGILTFPNSTSFGAVLQMYALYKTVDEMGFQAEIINYYNHFMKAERHTRAITSKSVIYGKLRLFAKRIMHYQQKRKFVNFERRMRTYPTKPISDTESLKKVAARYRGVICGSDQVWNPNVTGEDLSYFLNFCEKTTKRISYAPSFGITELEKEFQKNVKEELSKFESISVREEEGQHILEEMFETTYPLVLDPTLLVDDNEWSKLEKKIEVADEPYILYYTVRTSHELFDFCKKLAKKKHMKIIVVGGNFIHQINNKQKNVEYAVNIGPEEWLYLIHHANCIVTNSFHGTAFSINYKKDFYVEYSSTANSRLEQIIRTSELQRRVVQKGCAYGEESIDYKYVENCLSPLREKSIEFLRNSLC